MYAVGGKGASDKSEEPTGPVTGGFVIQYAYGIAGFKVVWAHGLFQMVEEGLVYFFEKVASYSYNVTHPVA